MNLEIEAIRHHKSIKLFDRYSKTEIHLVIARDIRVVETWARDYSIPRNKVKWITREDQLLGWHKTLPPRVLIHFLYGWWLLPSSKALDEIAHSQYLDMLATRVENENLFI